MTDLVLMDGSSYLYRAFHALPALTNAKGEPTGALHGVLTMILKLLREEQPAHIAVVFDAPGKTFRDEMYADYKATRPPMPDELRSQVQPILDAVQAMGLPLLRVDGVEADDVIGTLCSKAEDKGLQVLVSTGDKDLAQLVTDHVTLVNTMDDSRLDRDAVKAKFDVYPEQIIDYLALVGDSSDNIPGVPKVGPKTAAKWLNQYESAEGILEHGEEIKGKVGESLRDNVESLRLSQDLARIKIDVGLDVGIDDLKAGEANTEALRKLYSHFDLRSLQRGLDEEAGGQPEQADDQEAPAYETVLTWEAFDSWLDKLDKAELVAFDTETNSLDYMSAEIVGFSLSTTVGEACYVPVAHDFPGAPEQLPRDEVLARLKPWLENDENKKVGHHLKYDAHILARYDIALHGMAFDSMLESYVLNSIATRHDMDSVARHYLGKETIHYEDVAGKGDKQLTFNQVELETAAPYAAEDADMTLQLHETLWSQLNDVPALR